MRTARSVLVACAAVALFIGRTAVADTAGTAAQTSHADAPAKTKPPSKRAPAAHAPVEVPKHTAHAPAHARPRPPKPPAHAVKSAGHHGAASGKQALGRKHHHRGPAGHLGFRHGPGRAHIRFDEAWASYPAARYANLDAPSCKAELGRRGIAFTPVAHAPGVLAPVRLSADVGGVAYHTALPAHQRATSPFEVFDCRLVLALSDFSKILREHGVDEVEMFSAWRPPPKSWPDGELGRRHPGALAIDARRFGKRDPGASEETWLDVEKDFHGTLDAPPCGPDAAAPTEDTPAARELRSIVCAAADQHIFTSILTPDYNRAHFNHFHLEVTPEVSWYLVR